MSLRHSDRDHTIRATFARMVWSICLLAGLAMTVLPTGASAELVVADSGSGVDQIGRPQGLAVDTSSKLLYAVDSQNERVDVWNADTGEFLQAFGWGVAGGSSFEQCTTSCLPGSSGSGAGQFKNPKGIAVDNDSGSSSQHAVYVLDLNNNRIQKFDASGNFVLTFGDEVNKTTAGDVCTVASGNVCGAGNSGAGAGQFNFNGFGGMAVGAGGVVYVADRVGEGSSAQTRVQRFSPDGVLLGQTLLSVAGGAGAVVGLALDPGGNYIVATDGLVNTGAVRKYDPSGTLLWTRQESFNINSVATDSLGNVFVGDNSGEINAIFEYDSSGNLLRGFYGSLIPGANATALAPYENSNGDIFAGESRVGGSTEGRVLHLDVPSPGPVVYPPPSANFANPIGTVRATLHAEVNPEGKATTYHFEYVTQAEFEASGGWSAPGVVKTTETALPGSVDFKLHAAQTQIGCVNPEAEASSCLNPITEYRFRAVATNADGSERPGPETTFTTKPPLEFEPLWSTGVGTEEATLHVEANPVGFPASGYFEYVDDATYQASGFDNASKTPAGSPLDFGDGEGFLERNALAAGLSPSTAYHYRLVGQDKCKPAEPSVVCTFTSAENIFKTFPPVEVSPTSCANADFRIDAAAYLGDCRGYEMVSPVDKNGVNVEVVFNSNGYPAGLDQTDPDGNSIAYSAYRAFANPKSSPFTSQYIASRTGEGWQSESISPPREGASLYNFEGLEYQFKAFTEDLCSGWPLQDTANLLDPTPPGPIAGYPNLYRRDNCGPGAGEYEAITTAAPAGGLEPRLFYPELQGFSVDGSKALFSSKERVGSDEIIHVYEASEGNLNPVCILPDETANSSGCSLGTANDFSAERNSNLDGAVSEDGSVVYWSASSSGPGKLYARLDGQETVQVTGGAAQFWAAAEDGSRAIYAGAESLFSFNLGTKTSTLVAEGLRGVAGWSADASVVYFASTKNLATGATAGQLNFYRYANGTFRFIGTFVSDDSLSNKPSSIALRPVLRTARVTPDGDQVVFMSKASLTGYDNTDALSGEPDSEVFLYDATANGGEGQLRCISCNPTNERPSGRKWDIAKVDGKWAASWIPAWTNQLYAPRVISDDGSRVFFNSFDRLEARDSNGKQDVYQWEAPNSGDCAEGSPLYSQSAGGCIGLLSSGDSDQASELVDSSASGKDVFFKTYSSFLPQDPGLIDIYDARVGGGFPLPPTPPAACEGEACAPPVAAPNDPSPASAGFRGPGNETKPANPRKACPKGRRRVRRAGKSRCVKSRKKQTSGKRRQGRHAR